MFAHKIVKDKIVQYGISCNVAIFDFVLSIFILCKLFRKFTVNTLLLGMHKNLNLGYCYRHKTNNIYVLFFMRVNNLKKKQW